MSSTAACAPITSHTTSSSNVNSTGLPGVATDSHGGGSSGTGGGGSSLADKIHGLTEKIQALGHHRTDSEASARPRTGIKNSKLSTSQSVQKCRSFSVSSLCFSQVAYIRC